MQMWGDVSPAGVPLDMKGEGVSTGRPRGWLRGCCKPGRTVWGVTPSRGFEGRLLPTSAENLECAEESALHPYSITEPQVRCLSAMLLNCVLLNIEI